MITPGSLVSRITAVVLLAAILAVAVFGIALPVWTALAERRVMVEDGSARINQLASRLPDLDQLRRHLAALREEGHPDPSTLLQGDNERLASAGLQDLLRRLAGGNRATISSVRPNPATRKEGFSEISVAIAGKIGEQALPSLLYDIETHSPLLVIHNFDAKSGRTAAPAESRELRFSMTVAGFAQAAGGSGQ